MVNKLFNKALFLGEGRLTSHDQREVRAIPGSKHVTLPRMGCSCFVMACWKLYNHIGFA